MQFFLPIFSEGTYGCGTGHSMSTQFYIERGLLMIRDRTSFSFPDVTRHALCQLMSTRPVTSARGKLVTQPFPFEPRFWRELSRHFLKHSLLLSILFYSPQYSMPTVNNFSAWIEVDGKQLPEYGVQSSANGGQLIRTCWIPSEAGKVHFFVYWLPYLFQ
jgi:hypothetical protein